MSEASEREDDDVVMDPKPQNAISKPATRLPSGITDQELSDISELDSDEPMSKANSKRRPSLPRVGDTFASREAFSDVYTYANEKRIRVRKSLSGHTLLRLRTISSEL